MNLDRLNIGLVFFVVFIFSMVSFSSCGSVPGEGSDPKAREGLLDLKDWDFSKTGTVRLDGQWMFHWNKWADPDARITDRDQSGRSSYIRVPSLWNQFLVNDQPVGGKGYATYELFLQIPLTTGPCSIHIPEAGTAYRLFVDGREKLSVGLPGKTAHESVPKIRSEIVDFVPQNGRVHLAIHISNHHHQQGGLWTNLYFGPTSDVHKRRTHKSALNAFFFGAAFLMGLYHLGLFIIRKNERVYLYFSCFCLLVALRIIVLEERMLADIIPALPMAALIKMEYLTFYLGGGSILAYLFYLFPKEFNRFMHLIFQGVILCFSLSAFFLPLYYFTHTLLAFQLLSFVFILYAVVVVIGALKNKRAGTKTFLLGFMVFTASVINDLLHSMGPIHTAYLFQFGMFFFMLCQAIILLRKYAMAFQVIERQKTDLTLKNKLLDRELAKGREVQKALEYAAKQEKYALVGQVAGKMAHDFNNILGAIMGNAEIALLECKDKHIRQALEIIFEQTKRGKILTGNLVAFANDQEIKEEYFDLNEKLELVLTLMRKELEGIQVKKDFQETMPSLLADPGMIEGALVNIIHNAVHAMSKTPDPLLVLRTYSGEGRVCIEISDNGCGIPEKFQKDIYTPSFTLKGSKDADGVYGAGIKGTGYGMSNVKKYIEKHQGDIRFESRVGSGTVFTVTIPLVEKQLSQAEKTHISRQEVIQRKKILIVEDEPAISMVQKTILTSAPFFHTVMVAEDADSALDLTARHVFDLVSLDYMLPGKLNGIHIYRQIRNQAPALPIIFISGNIEFLESIESLKSADHYLGHLSKPCENLIYAETVNHWLGQREEG